MEAIDIATADVVARPSPAVDLGAVAQAPKDEPAVRRWPGWLRLAILFGGAAGVWAVIGWVALRLMRL